MSTHRLTMLMTAEEALVRADFTTEVNEQLCEAVVRLIFVSGFGSVMVDQVLFEESKHGADEY